MASDEKGLANDDLGRRIGQNIVDALYAQYSDHEAASIPKVFRAAADSYLMKEIARHGIDAKEGKTAWWSIVDEFATRKLFAQAKMAQRHAMPTITDLSSMMWQDQFSLARFGTDSAGMAQCLRSMADAIKRYMPVIADITRFDKGGAHVVVADLVDLQVHGGGIAAKLFELAYLGIAHSLYRDFFLTENDIEGLPDVFGAFHSPRILEARNSVRQISLDEMHRAATSHPAKEAFLRDAYSAKDVGAGFRLASQDLEAFHPRLAAEASNIVVLGCSPNNLENMNKLGLTPDGALEASRLHGPEKLSKTMIVRSQHDGIEDTVTITASPAAVWMTASSWVERDLREGATRRLGAVEALKILADEFPTGTATSRVEADAMRIARNDPHKRFEDAVKDIIEGLVADMAALST
jgi:intracellular multiplication protein IcmB